MIITKQIKSLSSKLPKSSDDTIYINVLTWYDESHRNGSKYYRLSPYFLKTDGQELNHNEGGVLFENFWQGSKLWPVFYDSEVWAHRSLRGKDEHLWFKYKCSNGLGYEHHLKDDEIQPEYYKWREAMFECTKPVRYPNGYSRRSKVAFSLLIDKDGAETRLDYIEARKEIYVKEYCRLVRQMPEFNELLDLLKQKKHLIICEVDVPDNEVMRIDKLEQLVNNTSIRFGHGLCLAWELLKEYQHFLDNEESK